MNLFFLFVVKILYSPLFPSCPWLNLHQTVLFSNDDQTGKGLSAPSLLTQKVTVGHRKSLKGRASNWVPASQVLSASHPEEFDMLLMDYVPDISVTKQVIFDLCIGKYIPGKIRIFHLERGAILDNHKNIMERVQQKIENEDYYDGSEPKIIPILCKYGVDQVILSQDRKYQLYDNNCWHFSKKCIVSTARKEN